MDSLPLFLNLIKNSVLLKTLLTTGGFNSIDLSKVDSRIFSNTAIEFKNMSLSIDDIFDTILYTKVPNDSTCESSGVVQLVLNSRDSKYFENINYYFKSGKQKYEFRRISDLHIDLGYMQIFEPPYPPAFISIIKNPQYGYGIYLTFYEDYIDRIKIWEQIFGK